MSNAIDPTPILNSMTSTPAERLACQHCHTPNSLRPTWALQQVNDQNETVRDHMPGVTMLIDLLLICNRCHRGTHCLITGEPSGALMYLVAGPENVNE